MKKLLALLSILILNLSSNAQVVSKFSWNGPLASVTTADNGPDAISVSSSAVASIISIIAGVKNAGISPGSGSKNIDLTLPNTTYFNVPSLDIAVDFRREETEASLLARGSMFDFGMNGGKLAVKFNIENGMGGNTTINSGNIYDIPNDHLFHNYRFMYDNVTGIANVWVDGIVKYSFAGIANRAMYWTGAGSPVIGKNMDATGKNVAVLDNMEIRTAISAIILPIKFLSFTATTKNSAVDLKWSTSNESNVKNFDVERSFDGSVFESLKTIPAQGQNGFVNHYEAEDQLQIKTVSYRIRSTDNDGKVSFSVIRTAAATTTRVSEPVFFPNPALSGLNVRFQSKEIANVTYSIYSQDGRRLQTGTQSVSKGFVTIAIQFSSNVPHNAMLMVILENNNNADKLTSMVFHK